MTLVSGMIIPAPAHVNKSADIIVVGLYTPDVNDNSCNPAKGTYYMMTKREALYCDWTGGSKWCNPNPVPKRGERTDANAYVTAWDGKLDTLAPPRDYSLFTHVSEFVRREEYIASFLRARGHPYTQVVLVPNLLRYCNLLST